jgi:hypothetical protein
MLASIQSSPEGGTQSGQSSLSHGSQFINPVSESTSPVEGRYSSVGQSGIVSHSAFGVGLYSSEGQSGRSEQGIKPVSTSGAPSAGRCWPGSQSSIIMQSI